MSPSGRIIYILDGHALIYRAYYAFISHPLVNDRGENTSAIFGFTRMLLRFRRKFSPDCFLVAFDSGKKTLRHGLYEEYKAHRKPMPDDLRPQIGVIREIVEALGIRQMDYEGYEADDIIATVCCLAVRDGLEARIVSRDKDLSQLINASVRMLLPGTGKDDADFIEVDEAGAPEKFLVPPGKIPDLLALMGDASDNIPGVRGIGPKTAIKLLDKYGTLDGLYAELASVHPETLREKLQKGREDALLSRTLATLESSLPIEPDWDAFRPGVPDRERLAPLLERYNLKSLVRDLAMDLPVSREVLAAASGGGAVSPEQTAGKYVLIETAPELVRLVDRLTASRLVSCDIETDGLDPLTNRILGISFAYEEGAGSYVAIRQAAGGRGLPPEEVYQALKPVLENPSVGKTGQNFKFDALFLAREGVFVRPFVFDTMLASFLCDPDKKHNLEEMSLRYLGVEKVLKFDAITKDGRKKRNMAEVALETVAAYSAEDADLTLRLAHVLMKRLDDAGLRKIHDGIDLPLSRILGGMERAGVRVDTEKLRSLSAGFGSEMLRLEKEIHAATGVVFNLNSPKQLQEVLFGKMGIRPLKKTKTSFSTDNEVLEELALLHPVARLLLSYRMLSKLRNTYTDRLPELIHPLTGRIHTSYNQTVAVTGRLSSTNPNLQNIPVKEDAGRQIREAFIPAEGCLLVSADYSQIELRILAHIAEDPALLRAFRNGEDVHALTAREILGIPADRVVSPEERRTAKVINFGVIYGMGPYNLSRQLGIPAGLAKTHIERYFMRYAGISRYYEAIRERLDESGAVENIFGRRRAFPGYAAMGKRDRESVFRMAINTPIQGTAADLIKMAMIRIDADLTERHLRSRMIMQVHDEIVLEVPEEEKEEAVRILRERMVTAADFRVPLTVDLKIGRNWAEAH